MVAKQILLVVATATLALGQRPFFAGSRPIGYPELVTTTSADALGNRFGDGDNSTTAVPTSTERLPVEANGDRELVNRLSKLPIDMQPFWFINWKALEENRKKPQTYPLRPSQFAEPLAPGTNSGAINPIVTPGNNVGFVNSNAGTTNPNTGSGNRNTASANVNTGTDNRNTGSVNPNRPNSGASNDAASLGNRFGDTPNFSPLDYNFGNDKLTSNNKGYVSSGSDIPKSDNPGKVVENRKDVVVPSNPLGDIILDKEPNKFQSTSFNSDAGSSGLLGDANSDNKESVNSESDTVFSNKANKGIYGSQASAVNRKPEVVRGAAYVENPLKDTVFNNQPNRRFQPAKSSNAGGSGIYQLHGSGPGNRYHHQHDYDFSSPQRSRYDPKDDDDYYY